MNNKKKKLKKKESQPTHENFAIMMPPPSPMRHIQNSIGTDEMVSPDESTQSVLSILDMAAEGAKEGSKVSSKTPIAVKTVATPDVNGNGRRY